MPLNASFSSLARFPPFSGQAGIRLDDDTACFHVDKQAQQHPQLRDDRIPHPYTAQVAIPSVVNNWRSQDNRKRLHPLGDDSFHPDSTANFRIVSRDLLRMCTKYP
ncbi:hypothetical protein N7508_002715 [Penicillium antarcticum]|uniref:uncharacterized protein n=1 Tax=Penicillium antarcticum TaxID=416450 RepID=UPI0023859E64|nr:uncharacterized protein N7508_002715 [Penicillium antarcticum]KAJ5311885.1 hypothetical protein N7508_002715 [Penicillium antarcticum]